MIGIDNNDQPLPENIPVGNTNNSMLIAGHQWGYSSVNQCVVTGALTKGPDFMGGRNPIGKSLLKIF